METGKWEEGSNEVRGRLKCHSRLDGKKVLTTQIHAKGGNTNEEKKMKKYIKEIIINIKAFIIKVFKINLTYSRIVINFLTTPFIFLSLL